MERSVKGETVAKMLKAVAEMLKTVAEMLKQIKPMLTLITAPNAIQTNETENLLQHLSLFI